MNVQDPYQPPRSSDYGTVRGDDGSAEVPAEAVQALRETRPWVTLLAVLGLIGAGFTVFGGLLVIVFAGKLAKIEPALGLVYVAMAGIYVLPSVLLLRYSSSIGRLLEGAGSAGLIDALRSQRSFWRAVGIMTLVFIVLTILVFIGSMAMVFNRRT